MLYLEHPEVCMLAYGGGGGHRTKGKGRDAGGQRGEMFRGKGAATVPGNNQGTC